VRRADKLVKRFLKIDKLSTALGAHLAHRVPSGGVGSGTDGAIVLDVDGVSPTWLMFSFSRYTF
jgi:hypothetical protein